ncbi:TIGR02186 family protein [soil metagenome]
MRTRTFIAAIALLLTCAASGPARAENLIVSVSNHRITVTPNYSGEELVLFGSIERDAKSQPPGTVYDIVVTVGGPRADMVTRRKERKLGIWINVDSREFIQVPSYLGIFANRPIDNIASPDVQRRQQIGMPSFALPQRMGPDVANTVANDPFRTAFVRLRTDNGLYREQTSAVTFLTPTLFRTGIPLPAEVAIGTYAIDIKLFANGAFLTRTETAFEIVKVGFEQFVANSARHHGLLYGLATAMMAIMTGWLASVIFRRD